MITAETNLGKVVNAEGKEAIDIAATESSTGIRYAISVKNTHERMRPNDKALNHVVRQAAAHGAAPWLAVPWAFPETIARCRASGIRLTLLGRQIVPETLPNGKRARATINGLRSVLGPQPFEYVGVRQDRAEFGGLFGYLPGP
jgi:hypothetical protein